MLHYHISFAGAGKVASALCRRMYESGIRVDLIVSPSETNGQPLAGACEASWSSVPEFPLSTDIIIVAVPDHALTGVLNELRCRENALVVHTAGSIGLDVFPGPIARRGVFYPLQTFSRGRTIDFTDVPLLLESSDPESSGILEELASAIGARPRFITTEQRIMLHLGAVFICNFTNHMLASGWQVAEKTGLPFEIFHPLINETVNKALALGPENSQTGPAIRNDRNTIEKHLKLLSFSPELQKMYREITLSIMNFYKKL